jgi:hypothetical protein
MIVRSLDSEYLGKGGKEAYLIILRDSRVLVVLVILIYD